MNVQSLYAPPKALLQDTNLLVCHRDGKFAVIPKGCDLPERCVTCNAPARTPIKPKKVYWHHQGWFLLILINIFIYAIVAFSVRKSASISAGLCELHIAKRRKNMLLGFAGCSAALLIAALMLYAQQVELAALAFLVAFSALVATSVMSRVTYPSEINLIHTKLSGCKEPFLAGL